MLRRYVRRFLLALTTVRRLWGLHVSGLKPARVFGSLNRGSRQAGGPMAGGMLGFVGSARVYGGNLSWDAQWQDLKDHMRGPNQDLNVMHTDVMVGADGMSFCALATLPVKYTLSPL